MRYATGEANHTSEQPYEVEDGVIVEPEPSKVRLRDRWEAAELAAYQPGYVRAVEEARWAARSGPCVVLRPGASEGA